MVKRSQRQLIGLVGEGMGGALGWSEEAEQPRQEQLQLAPVRVGAGRGRQVTSSLKQ